ncbi:HAD hydrolase family protein [Candidatus Microgenomates bacterium]|nr:HAD hydrolase family protein [Candidatus Microgenomates bacterium]
MAKENLTFSGALSWAEILKPQTEVVEVDPDVDFVYIMRKDGNFTMTPIVESLTSEYSLDQEQTKQILLEEYDLFFSKLADVFLWAFSSKGKIELHLYDPDILDQKEKEKAGILPIISLDPLMTKGVHEFEVSRGYYSGGKKDHGQVNRPGSKWLDYQAKQLAEELGVVPVCVVEDDIFSGGSLIKALGALLKAGVIIQKVIPGIQVGNPTKLEEMEIVVDPVVKYKAVDGSDIFDKVDLGDPRDFLLGASGLVIKLPDGGYGRAPYVLPFVSTAARASIPNETEKEFALKVLQANFEFFQRTEERINKSILLKHMDSYFVQLMHNLYGFDSNTPMSQVVAWSIENLDSLWKRNSDLGAIHEELEKLKLPANLIFIDVNGTLIAEDSVDGCIDNKALFEFSQAVDQLKKQGFGIGLCSDSPLPQLVEFSQQVGLADGPIIAENGSIISNNGRKIILNELDGISGFKGMIIDVASGSYKQDKDCVAPEFRGKTPDYSSNFWAFGANRETSVSVFGPPEFIGQLGKVFTDTQGISIDCSPKYNYFAIHPGDCQQNKGKTLTLLSQFSYNVIMIGNSQSDWVCPSTGARCAFVRGSRISEETKEKAFYFSDKPTINGVIDILSQFK